MPNTVFGPYTPKSWTNGLDAANATNMNHLETQASDALHGFNPDMIGAGVVWSGITTAKDGTNANQLDIASGVAYVVFSDGTVGRITVVTDNTHTTATPSTTYHLYLQPDGTWYWNTANTPAANSLHICDVTTDGSSNILAVTDARPLYTTMFSGMAGNPGVPLIVAQAIRVHVTVTTVQTILSYTPAANGLYRIITYAAARNSAPSLSLTAQWTDPDLGVVGPVPAIVVGPSPVVTANGYVPGSATALSVTPIVGWAATTGPIKVFYQNFGASPNDFVTAVIERLA